MSEIRSQATPAREELLENLRDAELPNTYYHQDDGYGTPAIRPATSSEAAEVALDVVEAAGWSKPRTVNSATELDALPVGSVALFGITPGYKRHDGLWETSGVNDRFTTNEVFESLGGQPATVLFTPGDAG